jgi:hypothetical protein
VVQPYRAATGMCGDAATGPHDANGLEPRVQGHDQVSTETAEEFIGKDQA